MTGQKELYDIFELIYPVGIIIELATNANPKDLFGIGEWEQIKDRFILAAGDSYAAGNTGGASTHVHSTSNHTLTLNEMPTHAHETLFYWPSAHDSRYIGTANAIKGVGNSTDCYAWVSNDYLLNITIEKSRGGSAAHNHGNTGSTSNMPPYYVAYLWRRVS